MENEKQKRGKRMKYFNFIMISLILSSCTYSITQVHTEGQASDVVQESASNTPNISPNISIPVKPL